MVELSANFPAWKVGTRTKQPNIPLMFVFTIINRAVDN